MSKKCSRKDQILALAISKAPSQCSTSSNTPTKKSVHAVCHKNDRPIVSTDIEKLWSRPYDFHDFPSIFDHKAEYENSFSFIKICDLKNMQSKLNKEMNINNNEIPETAQLQKSYIHTNTAQMESTNKSSPSRKTNTTDSDIPLQQIDIDATPQQINIETFLLQKEPTTTLDIDFNPLKAHTNQNKTTRANLRCYERMVSSDEENDLSTTNRNIFENSDDSVMDKDYEPNSSDTDSDIGNTQRDQNQICLITVDVHSAQTENQNHVDVQTHTSSPSVLYSVNVAVESSIITQEVQESDMVRDSGKGLTKAGLPRKRRKFEETLAERIKEKVEKNTEKLELRPPCDHTCRKKCSIKFSDEVREDINRRYVNLNWEGKGLFLKGYVEPMDVKCKTAGIDNRKRQKTNKYYLNKSNLERIEVCKKFFLSTLGYHPKIDTHLQIALKKLMDDQQDKRGKFERLNVIDKSIIKEHIQSFGPTISHYRREHAPNRLYLPSDVNITMMHQGYMEKHPDKPASLETYRRVVKKMNISFAVLGNEECEVCDLHKQHINNNECLGNSETCEYCISFNLHKKRYETSREEYSQDKVSMDQTDSETIYYSADLQKVIMLPRMDQYKIAIFCPRVIAFNESFVPLGPSKNDNVPFAVLWNESISGRNQEDLISAFRAFLLHKRDPKHIVIWADNCAAQNKNWALFCFLVNIINSNVIQAESITIKYFEPGHTYMSADHFHHQVESQLKRRKKVYDFDDFVEVVRASNAKKNVVRVMDVTDFFDFEDYSSQHILKKREPRVYLKDIMAVKVTRGEFKMEFKVDHELHWHELNFLQLKIQKSHVFPNPINRTIPRGITSERKAEIIAKLVPLMPETRRRFWEQIPVSDKP